MPIPNEIPAGARIVVRTCEGVDPKDQRMKFRDYVGHVRSWDGQTLEMTRDADSQRFTPRATCQHSRRHHRHCQTGSGTFHDTAAPIARHTAERTCAIA